MPKMGWLVDLVARAPARVQVKLLAAFLTIAMLLVMVGAVGLQVLRGVNERTEELIGLQRKIEAYRQVQHDTISQLYSVSSALLSSDEPALSSTLRQLNQFGYDVDRLQFVAKDEVELLGQFRQDYNRFVEIVTRGVEMIRAGRAAEAREIQAIQAAPLADRLERLTNQLVNKAEADMVAGIETSRQAYENSQWIVIAFALGSIMLALALGYIISWSLIGPVKQIEAQLNQVAAGHFTHRVDVVNRDEMGALGANVNKMSEELGQLYQQLRRRTDDLSESLRQQTATADVLKVISSSPGELKPVFRTILENATRICEAKFGTLDLHEGGGLRLVAAHDVPAVFAEARGEQPFHPAPGGILDTAMKTGRTIHIPDLAATPSYVDRHPRMVHAVEVAGTHRGRRANAQGE
jgi:HAMP domain-containing protein